MANPRRVPDAVRQAILADARATIGTPDGAVRRIAARHGVSDASVRRFIAAEPDIPQLGTPEIRDRMKNAIATRVLTMADRRARLSERWVEVAERALDDMESPATVFNFGGKDNTFEARVLPRPPTADRRNLAIIAATAVDKHKVLDNYDSDARDRDALTVWLEHMMPKGTDDGGA